MHDHGPPGKPRKLRDERSRPDIWNRRFQDPLRRANIEQFKAKVNDYEEQGLTFDKAVHLAANDDLPYLRKRLRQDYAQFLIDFYELQDDPIQQKILESARAFRNQHDMNQTDSIRQAIKLRKDLFMDLWPDHSVDDYSHAEINQITPVAQALAIAKSEIHRKKKENQQTTTMGGQQLPKKSKASVDWDSFRY